MKDKEFIELIKDKDLSKEEVIKEVRVAIDDLYNKTTIKSKDEKIAELQKKVEEAEGTLKTKDELTTKEKEVISKELETLKKSLAEKETNTSKLSQKYFIVKNVNKDLDEEAIEDLIDLASKKVSKTKKFEDAVKEVAEKYNFVKKANTNGVGTGVSAKANHPETDEKKERSNWVNSVVSFRRR